MTNEEAIGYLEYLYEEVEDAEDLNHALNIAIEALEKQIPKISNFHALGDKIGINHCSSCESILHYQGNYCAMCGQRMEW